MKASNDEIKGIKQVRWYKMPARSHGDTKTRLYNTWLNMRARCNRKSSKRYEDYGGRGIKVCDEWQRSYESFKEWALSNGYSEDLTIDRINVDGNYEPDNCRWITNKDQQNNKRNNAIYSFNGETLTLAQWSEKLGICYKTLQKRIEKWGIEKAFTTPLRKEQVIDITGQKFGRLKVVSLISTKGGARFKCICDCGNITIQNGYCIRSGKVVSCGCYNRQKDSSKYIEMAQKRRNEIAESKIILMLSDENEIVEKFNGVKKASLSTGIKANDIYRALRSKTNYAHGYYWKYEMGCDKCV